MIAHPARPCRDVEQAIAEWIEGYGARLVALGDSVPLRPRNERTSERDVADSIDVVIVADAEATLLRGLAVALAPGGPIVPPDSRVLLVTPLAAQDPVEPTSVVHAEHMPGRRGGARPSTGVAESAKPAGFPTPTADEAGGQRRDALPLINPLFVSLIATVLLLVGLLVMGLLHPAGP